MIFDGRKDEQNEFKYLPPMTKRGHEVFIRKYIVSSYYNNLWSLNSFKNHESMKLDFERLV